MLVLLYLKIVLKILVLTTYIFLNVHPYNRLPIFSIISKIISYKTLREGKLNIVFDLNYNVDDFKTNFKLNEQNIVSMSYKFNIYK